MASEEWRIVLSEDFGGAPSAGAPGGAGAGSKTEQEILSETKKSAPSWANVGKFAGGLLGVVGTLAFVIQMIRRSRVFSTFMDNFLLVFSAFIDIMMIPLIPVFGAALKWIVKLFPYIFELQGKITAFLKDPWGGIKDLFAKIPDAMRWLGDKIGGFFSGLGFTGLGDLFKSVGEKFGTAFENITPIFSSWIDEIQKIWGDKSTTFWEKIRLTAGTTWDSILESSSILWKAIKDIWKENVVPFIKETWNNFYNTTLIKTWNDFYNNTLIKKWNDFYNHTLVKTWEKFVDWVGKNWEVLVNNIGVAYRNFISISLPQIFAQIPGLLIDALKALFRIFVPPAPEKYQEFVPWGDQNKQFGGYIPQTGLYMLHRGEEIIPSTRVTTTNNNRAVNINNIFNISTDAALLARKVSTTLDEEIRGSYFKVF